MNFFHVPAVIWFIAEQEGVGKLNFDYQLFQIVNGWAGKAGWLDQWMELSASYTHYFIAFIIALFWFRGKNVDLREKNQKMVIYAVFSAIVALLGNTVLGFMFERPRPFVDHAVTLLLKHSADYSFPSDHSAVAMAMAFSLLAVYRKWGGSFIILTLIMMFARVYTGLHYPMDVLGGALMGMFSSLLVWLFSKQLQPLVRSLLQLWGKIEGKVLRKSVPSR